VQEVWYAAYGSNLSRERFDVYLRGGTPQGATHRYPGCRDAAEPSAVESGRIDVELCFGGWSQTWGGGVAFVRPESGASALARLYRMTLEQFEDVVAQENWLVPGSVQIEPTQDTIVLDGDHTYRVVIPLAHKDGLPVLTISQLAATDTAPPTPAYVRHIACGLREAHALDDDAIATYLGDRPGAPSAEVLAEALSSPS
jgi:hypothetical protein